ncbi:Flagellar basal-body rod protein FlgG [compost metagenome]
MQTSAVRNIHTQGNLIETGNKLDVAIIGQGWFQIEAADGSTLYSRAGAFNKNADGNLVTVDGYNVIPNINIPTDAQDITVTRTGQVTARIGNAADFTELGQLTIANFANEAGLKPLGDNLFAQTPASGDAVIGVPDDPSYGYIKQSYLEGSNVDAVKEITDLITAQRAYEMNSKVITTADEMASIVSKNLK